VFLSRHRARHHALPRWYAVTSPRTLGRVGPGRDGAARPRHSRAAGPRPGGLLSPCRLAAAAVAGFLAVGVPVTPAHAVTAQALTPHAVTAQALTPHAVTAQALTPHAVTALAEPHPLLAGDSYRQDEWQLTTLGVGKAWNYASGAGVTVAVIDSGVDSRHPDLVGQVLPGLDLVDPKGDGDTDLVGHGTTVSAIIAGRGDDNSGVVGIAPKARILPVRVLDEENRYDDAIIVAKAVRWAVDHGAGVINLSLGGSGTSEALAAALDYAFAKDVVVVACTGNTGASPDNEVWYPAREPGVLAVAGLERDGRQLWSGSITGRDTVVAAPATDLVGARSGGGYWRVQGTSFAAPMVAATAALVRSRWPDMPAGEVVNRIIQTARDLGTPGRDTTFGFGMVDPAGALTASLPTVVANPLDTTRSPGTAGFGSAPAPGQAQSIPGPAQSDAGQAQSVPGPAQSTPGQARSFPVPAQSTAGQAQSAAGQAQSAAGTSAGPVRRVVAADAGQAAAPIPALTRAEHRGRWVALALFLVSAFAAALTVRRFVRPA
jgi:serine protease